MSKQLTKKTKGTLQAAGVAFHQGFEGVLVTMIALVMFAYPHANATGDKAALSGAVLGVKELVALIIIVGWNLYKNGPKFFKNLAVKLRTRQGLWFALAGTIGTSMGNLFYILGILFAGAGYGAILTALYPVFSMILVKFVQKEKEPALVWVGVAVAVTGGFLSILLPSVINGGSFDVTKIIGMVFGLLAAMFWALEGLFINMGIKAKKQYDFTNGEIIITRNIFTTLVTIGVAMPVLMGMGNSFHYMQQVFSQWKVFLIVLAIAINILILRALHVGAIRNIGPKVTAIIDTNAFIVPALVAQIFVLFPALESTYSGSTIVWWAYLLLIPIVIGVYMVIHFHYEEPDTLPLDSIHWETEDKTDTPEI